MATHAHKAKPKTNAVPKKLKCSICDFHTKESTYSAQELGRHMKFVHGQAGASTSAVKQQGIKKENLAIEGIQTLNGSSAATTGKKERKQYTTNAEIQAAIVAGKITAYCEAEAEKLGISKEQFTRKVSELFFASQLRS